MNANLLNNRYNLAEFFFGVDAATENLYNVEAAIDEVYGSRDDAPMRTALMKYVEGKQHSFSSDLLGEMTAGYGTLGEYGDWEFPLPPKFIYKFLVTTPKV